MRAATVGGAVVVAAFGLLVVVLLVLSLPWPLVQDAPVMHYIAWRIGEGDVPYRDLYDINQPGVYVLHLALLRTLGSGDGAWRAFDLAWLAATAGAVALLAARWGAVAAAGAALAFAAYHLAGGAWQAGQRDFLLCVFLVAGALGVARWLERRGGAWSLAGAGLALGAAVGLKPYAVLFAGALGLVVLVAAARRRDIGEALRSLGAYVAGTAAVPAALGTWLALAGGLRAWADVVFGYAIPVYGHLGRSAPWLGHRWLGWIPLGLAALGALVAAVATRRADARHLVAAVGLAYGVAHYVGQAKGSEYHLYPLAAFVCVLAFSALTPALAAQRARLGVPLAVTLAAALVLLTAKGLEASDAPWIWDKERRVRVLVDDLGRSLAPGDTVQVLDIADGGLHALLRLRVRQPTRFLYDVFFFHEADRPVVRAIRAEFVAALEARPPRFIVLMRGWPSGDYDRIQHFPALADLLARRYDVVVTRDGYRLYARRAGA
ncbi:MAG TPA: hypothetical protein VE932_00725 [Patescibacteria group bacterium]|nr:hypothetical protein [Patescibacteria group bacterium]